MIVVNQRIDYSSGELQHTCLFGQAHQNTDITMSVRRPSCRAQITILFGRSSYRKVSSSSSAAVGFRGKEGQVFSKHQIRRNTLSMTYKMSIVRPLLKGTLLRYDTLKQTFVKLSQEAIENIEFQQRSQNLNLPEFKNDNKLYAHKY